jgi:ankyrin repeat protein
MVTTSIPVLCQTDTSVKTDNVKAKEDFKARKDALKAADKAIMKKNIDQLRAILEANPGLVSAPTPQSATAGVAATVLFGPVLASEAQSNVTLLHDAAEYGRADAVELLISYHANVNARDGLGYTPLHMAMMFIDSQSTDIVALLLDHGAEVNARAKNGDTPLRLLRFKKMNRTRAQPLQQFLNIEQLLLQHGAQ